MHLDARSDAAASRTAAVLFALCGGGEEFLLVLPSCPESEAYNVVQRLLDTWSTPVTTFSAGIALHVDGRSVEGSLEAADKALYDAKHGGRNRVHTAA